MLCYFLSILSLSKSNVTVNACAMEAGKELSKPMKLCIYWFHRLPPGFKDFSVVRSGLSPYPDLLFAFIACLCLLALYPTMFVPSGNQQDPGRRAADGQLSLSQGVLLLSVCCCLLIGEVVPAQIDFR